MPPGVGGGDYIDPQTSVPVYAVYGVRNAPTDQQLASVDLMVCDIQDVGVRFYTFMWTMTYCMEAAARNNKPFYIIDRPNPITGHHVEGACNTSNYGLVGRLGPGASFGLPSRHGMTMGEIATMWNTEWGTPKADLHVMKMASWNRSKWWDELDREFVAPSPNMRSLDAATIYPGTCIFEGSNISEGRGTDKPFEKIGAPFINASTYADEMTSIGLPGVRFTPISFTPTSSKFSGHLCNGLLITVTDREAFQPVKTGLYLLQTVYKLYPTQVTITSYAGTLMAIPGLQNRIKTDTIDTFESEWQTNLDQFKTLREKYLLYPEVTSASAEWKRVP